ncbi:hypothetical protein J3R30DRAFT_3553976, partial [Lentinula aciculospora]
HERVILLYLCKLSHYEASQFILLLRYITYILLPLHNYFMKEFRCKAITHYLLPCTILTIPSFVLYLRANPFRHGIAS